MALNCGIVGLPNVGKSTIFSVLSSVPTKAANAPFCPLDLFDYVHAVLHFFAYREFLHIDFPRIPYPADQQTFWKLVILGDKLRQLHLLEGSEFEDMGADSVLSGKVSVKKIRYSEGKVFVNDDFYFIVLVLTGTVRITGEIDKVGVV